MAHEEVVRHVADGEAGQQHDPQRGGEAAVPARREPRGHLARERDDHPREDREADHAALQEHVERRVVGVRVLRVVDARGHAHAELQVEDAAAVAEADPGRLPVAPGRVIPERGPRVAQDLRLGGVGRAFQALGAQLQGPREERGEDCERGGGQGQRRGAPPFRKQVVREREREEQHGGQRDPRDSVVVPGARHEGEDRGRGERAPRAPRAGANPGPCQQGHREHDVRGVEPRVPVPAFRIERPRRHQQEDRRGAQGREPRREAPRPAVDGARIGRGGEEHEEGDEGIEEPRAQLGERVGGIHAPRDRGRAPRAVGEHRRQHAPGGKPRPRRPARRGGVQQAGGGKAQQRVAQRERRGEGQDEQERREQRASGLQGSGLRAGVVRCHGPAGAARGCTSGA